MMQAFLADQAKIRRRLIFVNKIGRRFRKEKGSKIHTGMYCRNNTVCIGETYQYVLVEHTGMYWSCYLGCFEGRMGAELKSQPTVLIESSVFAIAKTDPKKRKEDVIFN